MENKFNRNRSRFGGVREVCSLSPPAGKSPDHVLLHNGQPAQGRQILCFLSAAILPIKSQHKHFKGEGQRVAIGPARVTDRGARFGADPCCSMGGGAALG